MPNTAKFCEPIRRIEAHAGGVVLEDARGHRSRLEFRRTLRVAGGQLFVEPPFSDWYSWVAFHSWRSQQSKERKFQN